MNTTIECLERRQHPDREIERGYYERLRAAECEAMRHRLNEAYRKQLTKVHDADAVVSAWGTV